jgi:protein LTV1
MMCSIFLFQKARTKKRPFIDRRNERTTTFALVHRSQKDPLAADSDAPQRVLQQLPEVVKRKEEERSHGIFYEDEYDYLQHLKNR